MNKTRETYRPHHVNHQRGFTLVEIMVAITIGLVMMAGIMQISMANKESSRLQRNMGFVQQNIRTAMDMLTRDIKQAGYYEDDDPANRIQSAPGPITPFLNVVAPTAITTAAVTADGGGNNNDQITLTYEASTETPNDCLGTPPTTATAPPFAAGNRFIINHYFVANQRLMCRGNTGGAQPLVEGVESLQILYGVNTDGDPRSANRYVQAHEVSTGGHTMADVVSVRIGMRFISRESVRPTADTNSYALLDASAVAPGGRFLRRELTTTISLRNE